ncbi:hypothetical protein HD554DRAFT_2039219 [Boletus coccyginus]|nr:hypothetical protein HD554DRAFT_2039219 [Boletus coccyginus]
MPCLENNVMEVARNCPLHMISVGSVGSMGEVDTRTLDGAYECRERGGNPGHATGAEQQTERVTGKKTGTLDDGGCGRELRSLGSAFTGHQDISSTSFTLADCMHGIDDPSATSGKSTGGSVTTASPRQTNGYLSKAHPRICEGKCPPYMHQVGLPERDLYRDGGTSLTIVRSIGMQNLKGDICSSPQSRFRDIGAGSIQHGERNIRVLFVKIAHDHSCPVNTCRRDASDLDAENLTRNWKPEVVPGARASRVGPVM